MKNKEQKNKELSKCCGGRQVYQGNKGVCCYCRKPFEVASEGEECKHLPYRYATKDFLMCSTCHKKIRKLTHNDKSRMKYLSSLNPQPPKASEREELLIDCEGNCGKKVDWIIRDDEGENPQIALAIQCGYCGVLNYSRPQPHKEQGLENWEEELVKEVSDEMWGLLPPNFNYKNCDRKTLYNWAKTKTEFIIKEAIATERKRIVEEIEKIEGARICCDDFKNDIINLIKSPLIGENKD